MRDIDKTLAAARLTLSDAWLLVFATATQLLVRGALVLMPLPSLRDGAAACRPLARLLLRGLEDRIPWAIEASGSRLGHASSCLTRALAGEALLHSTAAHVELTIGVRHSASGTLESHAWLTRDDRIVIGAPAHGYVPIATWTRLPS